MSSVKFAGPTCRFRLLPDIDDGTLCRHVSVSPGHLNGISLWPEMHFPDFFPAALGMNAAITEQDKIEFAVIQKMPVLDSRRRAYKKINQYVSDRTIYFGSPIVYQAFAADSDAELANTSWPRKKGKVTLQSMIEFTRPSERQKQQIFYRWVRKAYKKKYGEEVEVPELIRKGMSKELANRIAEVRGSVRVKKIHDEEFHAGGFNPRPVKFAHHYLLGTLSEHATGMAVDIDDSQNAQLTADEWKFIETLVGVKVKRSGRWDTEAAAQGLWSDINHVNTLFVEKVAAETKRIVAERTEREKKEKEAAEKAKNAAQKTKEEPAKAKTGAAPAMPVKVVSPLQEVLGKHAASLTPWVTKGFFNLPVELVLELHAHGFTWGATFPTNVDLHHFQLNL